MNTLFIKFLRPVLLANGGKFSSVSSRSRPSDGAMSASTPTASSSAARTGAMTPIGYSVDCHIHI